MCWITACLERASPKQRQHFAGLAPPTVRLLAEYHVVEQIHRRGAHRQYVRIAPVAGDADAPDRLSVRGPERLDELSQRRDSGRIVGVVEDDPKPVGVMDVEPAGIIGERGLEAGESRRDRVDRRPQPIGDQAGRQGVGDVELRLAPQRRRDRIDGDQRQSPIAIEDDQFAARRGGLEDGDDAAFGDVLLQVGRQIASATEGEESDPSACVPGDSQGLRIVAVEHRKAAPRYRFGDDGFHRGQIFQGVDVL